MHFGFFLRNHLTLSFQFSDLQTWKISGETWLSGKNKIFYFFTFVFTQFTRLSCSEMFPTNIEMKTYLLCCGKWIIIKHYKKQNSIFQCQSLRKCYFSSGEYPNILTTVAVFSSIEQHPIKIWFELILLHMPSKNAEWPNKKDLKLAFCRNIFVQSIWFYVENFSNLIVHGTDSLICCCIWFAVLVEIVKKCSTFHRFRCSTNVTRRPWLKCSSRKILLHHKQVEREK